MVLSVLCLLNVFFLFQVYECPICLELLKEPKLLISCGHSLCEKCLEAIKSSDTYICPQCRTVSNKTVVNYTVKNALEVFQQKSLKESNKEFLVKSCCHTEFVSDRSLEKCEHCKGRFCSPCLLSHKVFLRLEAGVIASEVRPCFNILI